MKTKRRKVEPGVYEFVDERGNILGRAEEWGNKWYRWHVIPADGAARGWDSETLSGVGDALIAAIGKAK